MMAQPAIADDPDVEGRLTIIHNQSSQDEPVIPTIRGLGEMPTPESCCNCECDENEEEDNDSQVGPTPPRDRRYLGHGCLHRTVAEAVKRPQYGKRGEALTIWQISDLKNAIFAEIQPGELTRHYIILFSFWRAEGTQQERLRCIRVAQDQDLRIQTPRQIFENNTHTDWISGRGSAYQPKQPGKITICFRIP